MRVTAGMDKARKDLDDKPRVLIPFRHFSPGYRVGGPLTNVINLVEGLGDTFAFQVVSLDHDLNETKRYARKTSQWLWHGKGLVYYAESTVEAWIVVTRAIAWGSVDAVYLDGLFDPWFGLAPWCSYAISSDFRSRPGSRPRLLCCPSGQLMPEALQHHPWRKHLVLKLMRSSRMLESVVWLAGSKTEYDQLRALMGKKALVRQAAPRIAKPDAEVARVAKVPGRLRLVFVGRLHPHKRLAELIAWIGDLDGKVDLTIIGLERDPKYKASCMRLASRLPEDKRVVFLGAHPRANIPSLLRQHHALVLLSKSESFGHAIIEAMACGRPVLIADTTPWRGLQRHHAGWDISVTPASFRQVAQKLIAMNDAELSLWCEGALAFAQHYAEHDRLGDVLVRECSKNESR